MPAVNTDRIEKKVLLRAPRLRVWRALTSAQEFGQWFGVEYASGFFHEFAGWVVYVFAFACLVGLHSLMQVVGKRQHARTRP